MAKKKPTAKKKKHKRMKTRLPLMRADIRLKAYQKFISCLAQTGNVRFAASEAKIDYSTVYKRRNTDLEFAMLFEEALDIAADQLEGEAFRRAMEGWDENVFGKDGYVGTVKKYSDTLLIFLLKGRRKKIYGDNFKLSGDPESPLVINADNLTREELLAEIAATSQRLGIAGLLATPANAGISESALAPVPKQPAGSGDKQ
jgi:hypothetical protein